MQPATGTPEPYIGIALDHGVSFDAWLKRWKMTPDDRVAVKGALVEVYLDLEISALIVGFDLARDAERIIQRAAVADTDIWIGLPDDAFTLALHDRDELDGLVAKIADWGATGIKVGIHALDDDWDDVLTAIFGWADHVGNRGMELIVEPMFRREDGATVRSEFLGLLKACSTVRYAKLDVHDPARWSVIYGQAFTPWVARSEGLAFDTYSSHLAQSLCFGCKGTMVGGAAWGISEFAVLGDDFISELARRVDELRRLWATPSDKATAQSVGLCPGT